MKKLKLHWQILIAIILACIAGSLSGIDKSFLGIRFFDVYNFIGTLFLNALKMIMIPLIITSIISGVSGMGRGKDIGRLGAKTIALYLLSSFLAILIGVVLVNLISPGIIQGVPAGDILGFTANNFNLTLQGQQHDLSALVLVFSNLIPENIFKAAVNGELLGLISFSILFGFFMMRIDKKYSVALQDLWQGLFETMMQLTLFIMLFAPIGVFGLVAKSIAMVGFDAFRPLLSFFITVVAALAIHSLVTLPVLLIILGRTNPLTHYKNVLPAWLMAFSTSSSSATLPVTIECLEKNVGVSNKISSFVLPLGATVNMDGTALYECVAALFIAQAYGLHLGFATQVTVVFVALLTSIGVAGIPAASLVAIALILKVIGLPLEGVGMILVVDRFLDMLRTAVNVFSDTCTATIVAATEGECVNMSS